MPPSSPFSMFTRRRALKLGLAGAALLLLGGGGLVALRGRAPHVPGLRALDAHGYRTLIALAKTHLPQGGSFELGAEDLDLDLARAFDAYLADLGPHEMSDLKTALVLLELGPVLFDGRLATFADLSPDERARHWAAWGESRLLLRRQVAIAFRKFLSFVFYDQPEVWPHIGYGGPLARPVTT
jgi:hypothetical protein